MPYFENQGGLEVITGCMFSGKTEELIRRLIRVDYARLPLKVFKPLRDTRSTMTLRTHLAKEYPAQEVENPQEILECLGDALVVGIDEVQFLGASVVPVVRALMHRNIRVIVSGLDLDYREEPFGPMPQLLALATEIVKLHAVCSICGAPATRSKLIRAEGASGGSNPVLIGAAESYSPRCLRHYQEG